VLSLLVLGCSAFVLAILLTPVCRKLAHGWGIVDRPTSTRKIHQGAIPRLGGLAILAACAGSCAVLSSTGWAGAQALQQNLPRLLSLATALGLVFLIGLADDVLNLKPRAKLAGQTLAALAACASGVLLHHAGAYPLPLWAAVAVSTLWLVGCMNALNLIDGLDGLAAGAGLFASLALLLIAIAHRCFALELATVALIGATLGFLCYNFNPASIFLGDCGSLTIGFALGCFGVVSADHAPTLPGMLAPLFALALPFAEVAVTIARRALRGDPVFGADRRHIHHRLLDLGLRPRAVALLLYAACGLAALSSVALSFARGPYATWIAAVSGLLVWLAITRLGYAELGFVGRVVHPRIFHAAIRAQAQVQRLKETLERAGTVEECWLALVEAAARCGFAGVSIQFGQHLFFQRFEDRGHDAWQVLVPLPGGALVRLELDHGAPPQPMLLQPLADLLREALAAKPAFAPRVEPRVDRPAAVAAPALARPLSRGAGAGR
jgi:UDP-GlcNAc:undecaprenyl-phosphate GlcNAc-1-phosphate transferase